MTVVNDNDEKGQLLYERMIYVEFLEFIGRVALIWFIGTEQEEEKLGTKIFHIIEEMLLTIKLHAEFPNDEEEIVSASDDED